jgi:uncharacterized protein (TIGR03084 family)
MKAICSDLKWEQETLDALVSDLAPSVWKTITPGGDWTVKDEICHLAYFDYTARLSSTDAQAFNAHLVEMFEKVKRMEDVSRITLAKGRAMTVQQLIDWWRSERYQLINALSRLDPKDRLPWYGPPMSARSFATARLMETWAHGQDIYDVLKKKRPVSPGLKHIVHLGVTTFGWSFSNRGMDIPDTQVRVEVTAPSGDIWRWGDDTAHEVITGPAEDFCLVVTQRRHVDDTALETIGETARQWMLLAQAFAGPPTMGPTAGTRLPETLKPG